MLNRPALRQWEDETTRWNIIDLGIRKTGDRKWAQFTGQDFHWDSVKEQELKVAFYNPFLKCILRRTEKGVCAVPYNFTGRPTAKCREQRIAALTGCIWVAECTGHRSSANEAEIAIFESVAALALTTVLVAAPLLPGLGVGGLIAEEGVMTGEEGATLAALAEDQGETTMVEEAVANDGRCYIPPGPPAEPTRLRPELLKYVAQFSGNVDQTAELHDINQVEACIHCLQIPDFSDPFLRHP